MIYLKTDEEIELLRESNMLVGKTLGEIAKWIEPGVTTQKLDEIAETFIRDNKGVPGFLNYRGFPKSLCTSVNEQVVHGIPNDKPLTEGDIVSIDCGVLLNGFHGDSAYTFEIGEVKPEIRDLLKITKESLYKGIAEAVEGKRIGDIGNAIQMHCEKAGFSVVREMVGHGVGRQLHEDPDVPNYGHRGAGKKMRKGMVIAIEPMINFGKKEIVWESDGWTVRTADRSVSAHFEHSVAIRKNGADILSSFKFVEEVLSLRS
ncbi:MAG: type I methionyl aminopeptidase [Cytophagaceae bacterium]|jgi:methionyl aminopeptidase|nr:type I methionyl aminopeptidase [Cytophagaceae bacterium]